MLSVRLFILWLHLLSAVVWVGGLLFFVLVATPTLTQAISVRERVRIGLSLEVRFRYVMWPAVGVVLFTGLINVMQVLYATSVAGGRIPSLFVRVLGIKLALVLLMVVIQAVQQLVIRPQRLALLGRVPLHAEMLPVALVKLQRLSQSLHILTLCVACVVLWCALLLHG
jgi:putative copper export protein